METLKDLVALVAGGAGIIGSATVRAFLALGATVVVPSRSQQRLDDLIATVQESRYLKAKFAIISVEPSPRERIVERVVCASRDFI